VTRVERIIEQAKRLPQEEQKRLRKALDVLDADSTARSVFITRKTEAEWINQHRDEYLGEWVALQGDCLIAHGSDARQVYLAAREAGISTPYVVRVERVEPFTGGWL